MAIGMLVEVILLEQPRDLRLPIFVLTLNGQQKILALLVDFLLGNCAVCTISPGYPMPGPGPSSAL
jgi:hypothetical protein